MRNLGGFLAFVIENYCSIPKGVTVDIVDRQEPPEVECQFRVRSTGQARMTSFALTDFEAKRLVSLVTLVCAVRSRVDYCLAELDKKENAQ